MDWKFSYELNIIQYNDSDRNHERMIAKVILQLLSRYPVKTFLAYMYWDIWMWDIWVLGHKDMLECTQLVVFCLSVLQDERHTDVILPEAMALPEDLLWLASSYVLLVLWRSSFGSSIHKLVCHHSALCSAEEQCVKSKQNTSCAFSFGTWDSMLCAQLCVTWHSGASAHGVIAYLPSQKTKKELCRSQGINAEYWSWVQGLSKISSKHFACDQCHVSTAARQGYHRSRNFRATLCLARGQRLP